MEVLRTHHSNASRCVPTKEEYWPPLASNSIWVPSSVTLPPEQTAILCAFCTVLSRWAITNDVLPFIRWSRASCTRRSLVVSRALVACTKKISSHINSPILRRRLIVQLHQVLVHIWFLNFKDGEVNFSQYSLSLFSKWVSKLIAQHALF